MFKLIKGISLKAWGDVDKTAIRNGFVKALESKDKTVPMAIRAVYAVTKDPDLSKAPSQNWWGPYREVRSDGSIIINKGGLYAVAAALSGARTEPSLTTKQKQIAARHVASAYRSEKLTPPASLLQLAGEISNQEVVVVDGVINGEMSVDGIPVANGVDVAKLKEGDDDPLEVVVEIDSGKNTRGWNYLPATVEKIVKQVNEKTPNGILGHQKQEDLAYQFPKIATHWVGAVYKDGKAFVRGVIDASQKDLKRWIKTKRISQVSIFGVPTLKKVGGETQVVDFKLLSLDWTPKDRNGMPTKVVAMSEMDSNINNGGVEVTKKETLENLNSLLKDGEISLQEIKALTGEMQEVEILKDVSKELKVEPEKVLGEIARLKKVEEGITKVKHDAMVKKVLEETIKDKTIRTIVSEMLQSNVDSDENKVKGEIEEILKKDSVKSVISSLHLDEKPDSSNAGNESRRFTKYVKTRIV